MKKLSVYSAVLEDIKKAKERYRDDGEIADFIMQIKRDAKRCKDALNLNESLYKELCGKALKPVFGDKDILEALAREAVDYKKAFSAEITAKCAVLHTLAIGNENAVKHFYNFRNVDFTSVFKLCPEEKYLENLEGFNISDADTKMLYRKKMLEKCDPEKRFLPPKHGEITLALEILLPIIICIILSFYTRLSFLLFFPVWQICSALIVRISMRIYKTEKLPRVKKDFLTEENSKTVIAVSALLTDADSLKNMEEHIEKLYFSNCSRNIALCILADLKPSATKENRDDANILYETEKTVKRINERCQGVFCLVRPREYSKTQNEFIGRERKRGAIEDLASLLGGEKTKDFNIFGELPKNVKYILALDSDTSLTPDCAEELLQTALHPANSRYGIFGLRTETDNVSEKSTAFSRIMAGDGGIAAYHSAFSERYQDIFGEGIFSGKGLVNISKYREKCSGKFESETVLSHDILEGELLKTAFVSDCTALEHFPTNELSYLKRLHRWVRGDWQNSVFLFSPRFSFLSKFKIFDNLRRSVTPLSALISIAVSAFLPVKQSLLLFITALLSVMINDILSVKIGSVRLSFSGNIPYPLAPFVRAFTSLMMLPAESLICLDGAVKGIYRRLVSKKNMLLWTTAQQGENSRAYKRLFLLPNIVFGLLILSHYSYIRLISVIFISGILFFILSGKKKKPKTKKLQENIRKTLISDAERMWQYFADFANRENNFLPPDNVQLSPVRRVAKRTSPTNIGLMLASCLSAYDLGIIAREEMLSFLENTISTVERLKTFHGNLYNWYDTETLEVMEPFFVSSVDSGNFLCALTALKNGLMSIDGAEKTVKRIDKILRSADLSFFFNRKSGLLHVGFDGKMTESCYALLMSEARLSLYYAVASRRIPKEYREKAGRRIRSRRGFSGPVSWNGTVFEYFMPNIFIPAYKNTIEYEGLKFCLMCQKEYARKNKIPFGISESCYYDFDENMNYRYRAHGVKKLALNRETENSLVVSPYSTYLVLPFDPKFALKNLGELRKTGALGDYGFFEAVDFSKNETVDCFMAHHIGMSILSVDNFLNNGIMQKRFMKEKGLSAEILLHEEVSNRPFSRREKRKM